MNLERARRSTRHHGSPALRKKRIFGGSIASPVSRSAARRTRAANSGCVLSPVPVAVRRAVIWATCGSAASTRLRPSRDLGRVAANSWPRVTGTASMRWVAAGLDDLAEAGGLRGERPPRAPRARESAGRAACSSEARWTAEGEHVIRGLAEVDVIVGCVAVTGERRDHLVRVRVGRVPEPVWKTSIGTASRAFPRPPPPPLRRPSRRERRRAGPAPR